MKTAVLRGREHTRLGDIAAISEGRMAIAMSRGGAPKPYAHKDPNEDIAAFTEAEGGVLLVVADGHGGIEASDMALDHLLAGYADRFTAPDAGGLREDWNRIARTALYETSVAIVGHSTEQGSPASRTTLVVAVVRSEGWMAWASMGDSHLFQVSANGEAADLVFRDGEESTFFLGYPAETQETLAEKCRTGIEDLSETRALVLVTDGISERGIGVDIPESTVVECTDRALRAGTPNLCPLGVARGVVEEALDAHRRNRAGDNVASAVAWLEGAPWRPQTAG